MTISEVYNIGCMEYMKGVPDKFFDLSIVDPPYGINISLDGCGSRYKKYKRNKENNWDNETPSYEFFKELFRVSKNHIIWGMNYFSLPPCKHFIVWDKKQPDGVTFAQAEIAWTSFPGTSKIYRKSANGQENRIHPSQKPISLYAWILKNYAKEGDKILDTHLGSGSSRIAAFKLGFDFYATEIDENYFKSQEERFRQECFGEIKTEKGTLIQTSLFGV